MDKKLPKMYAVNFDKEIKNNRELFSTLNRNDNVNKNTNNSYFDIRQKINNIFSAKDYIYKIDVTIVTDNKVLNKRIIGKNNNNLITIDNEHIPISSIRDIYKN